VNRRYAAAGFTMAELLVTTAMSSVIMAGLATGTIALQRGYAAADYSIRCQVDQMRVIDYISRDLRRAQSVTTENLGRKLVLTVPDQQVAGSRILRVPTVTGGVVRYGGAAISISYYIEGDVFYREEAGVRAAIANKRLENFLVSIDAEQVVSFQLAFTPTFTRSSGYGQAAATIVTSIPLSETVGVGP
jgi:Tfp pilus assembly protein PilW